MANYNFRSIQEQLGAYYYDIKQYRSSSHGADCSILNRVLPAQARPTRQNRTAKFIPSLPRRY